jgi:hypothetical protein
MQNRFNLHTNLSDDKSTIRMLLGKGRYALPYIPYCEVKPSSLAWCCESVFAVEILTSVWKFVKQFIMLIIRQHYLIPDILSYICHSGLVMLLITYLVAACDVTLKASIHSGKLSVDWNGQKDFLCVKVIRSNPELTRQRKFSCPFQSMDNFPQEKL